MLTVDSTHRQSCHSPDNGDPGVLKATNALVSTFDDMNKEENLFPDEQREESLCVNRIAGLIDTEAAWISFVLDQLIIEQRWFYGLINLLVIR